MFCFGKCNLFFFIIIQILFCGTLQASSNDPHVSPELLKEINSYKLKKPIYRTKSQAKLLLENVIARIRPSAESICTELSATQCDWELEVVSGNQFNAYASGKNKISFYTGLVRGIHYEEELAFVVAHEMGHHIGNHLNEAKRSSILGALLGAAIALETDSPEMASDAANIGAYIGRFSYSRQQEIEADTISRKILIDSGYDMEKARAGLIRLTRTGLSKATSSFGDSHPSGPERILIWDTIEADKL